MCNACATPSLRSTAAVAQKSPRASRNASLRAIRGSMWQHCHCARAARCCKRQN